MRALTSASNLFRRKLCPGSENAEANVAEFQGDNAPADEGRLLHPFACNLNLKRDHLTGPQQSLLGIAQQGTAELMRAAARAFDCYDPPAKWIEERLDLIGPDGDKLLDGQSDAAYLWADHNAAAVEDFKLGFVKVTPAEQNYQLAAYAVMWTDYLGVDRILVALNQPRNRKDQRLTLAVYERRQLNNLRADIAGIVHAARDPKAPRIAGNPQCDFCRAKLFCDEYKARFEPLAVRPDVVSIETLPQEQLHRLGIACKTADQIKRMVFEEIRRRIEAGEMDNWELEDSGELRELTDIVGAFRELAAYFSNIGGFTGQAFTECTKIEWGKLTKLVRELTGFSQNRSAGLINELLNPYISRKKKKESVQPIP